MQTAAGAGLEGLPDPRVLRIAATAGRVLVSQDRRTMPLHFQRYVRDAQSAGVILLREAIPIGVAIEELFGTPRTLVNGSTGWCGFRFNLVNCRWPPQAR